MHEHDERCRCNRFQNRVGYRGQKYMVFYTRDGEEKGMGWQNNPSGGLEDAAKLMPGVTSTRVAEVLQLDPAGWCSSCDLIAEHGVLDQNGRQCCMKCGDYLIFANDEK